MGKTPTDLVHVIDYETLNKSNWLLKIRHKYVFLSCNTGTIRLSLLWDALLSFLSLLKKHT